MVTIELKPGGEEIPVTEDNKKDYVDCVVEYRISKRVKEQFDAFMSGFSELIPHDLITVFDERELELLIGGMSEIDVYVFASLPCSCLLIGFQRRLEQVHRLPWLRGERRSDSVVLEVRSQLATGAQVSIAAIRDRNFKNSCEWIQGFTRLRRSTSVHD